MIIYKKEDNLELWVKDTGVFDGFAVYIDGSIVHEVGDQATHKYPITRPEGTQAVAVNFGGNDGGSTAVVDVTGGAKKVVEKQEGINHAYMIQAG